MSDSSARKPTVFISSTCYDLKQIRRDLYDTIHNQFGYETLISENDSFPLNPNINAVDNCLYAVDERADIFILIIGGRYGSVMTSGKSITNMEYLRAKAKGIPIYVFVDLKVLNSIQLWKDNPAGNFTSVVDTPQLFEFVEEIRTIDNVWVYGFDIAQDIAKTINNQLGYLFYASLTYRQRMISKKFSNRILALDNASFRIIVEKPFGWEYKLLNSIIKFEFEKYEDFRLDLKYSISLGQTIGFDDPEKTITWVQQKMSMISNIIHVVSELVNKAFYQACGKEGEEGNPEEIAHVAKRFAEAYRDILLWGLEFKRIQIESQWEKLFGVCFDICNILKDDMESFKNLFNDQVSALPEKDLDGKTYSIICNLTFRTFDTGKFDSEIEKIGKYYGIEL